MQDETVFEANDGRRRNVHTFEGQPTVMKKGKGQSLHVSEFVSEETGPLKLTMQQVEDNPWCPDESAVFLKIGKNADGYWKSEHVLDQVIERAIPIFEITHPGCQALFLFDQSTVHSKWAADALRVNNMNLQPGGSQAAMRDGWFEKDGVNHTQPMSFPANHSNPKHAGKPKGMKQVLLERGLWISGMNKECSKCTSSDNIEKHDMSRRDCCAKRILSTQPDFLEQKPLIIEEIKKRGHLATFLPKCHPELNFIESYWAFAKNYARKHCNYTWQGLLKTVPEALRSVSLSLIRKLARRSWRHMDAYTKGLSAKLAELAVRKFHGHRRIAESYLRELDTNAK